MEEDGRARSITALRVASVEACCGNGREPVRRRKRRIPKLQTSPLVPDSARSVLACSEMAMVWMASGERKDGLLA